MLSLLFAVFVLEAFKHGFVADANMPGVFISLTVYILMIAFLYTDRLLIWSLSIVMVLAAVTSVRHDPVLVREVHDKFGTGSTWRGENRADIFAFCVQRAADAISRSTYKSTWNTYRDAWEGFRARVSQSNGLNDQFASAMATITRDYTIPALGGTSDIYANEQSVLLASNNQWNPRPMFQSVTAFTPPVIRLNEQHLRGPNAPDWVLFDLETIYNRLPSLDDGLSWPAFFDNYTFVSYDSHFVLMRKNHSVRAASNYDEVSKKICKTGETVTLPGTDGLLFAEVELKPTLAGQVLATFYKPPQLHIVLGMGDGTTRSYRVVSNMMETGFLLSPFVSNTAEFASLDAGSMRAQGQNKVVSISIAPAYGGSILWSGTYELTLKRYTNQGKSGDRTQ
jgi:hypothetical protein